VTYIRQALGGVEPVDRGNRLVVPRHDLGAGARIELAAQAIDRLIRQAAKQERIVRETRTMALQRQQNGHRRISVRRPQTVEIGRPERASAHPSSSIGTMSP
jgi:hypothetical protein